MKRAEFLDKLQVHTQTLAERFGVTRLAMFGSYARDQATMCVADTPAVRQ